MRPDLVLDDDDKRKRFRKLFLPTSDYGSQQQVSPVETPQIILEDGAGAGGEAENYCEEIPQPGMALQLDVENIAQDESFVDPETG